MNPVPERDLLRWLTGGLPEESAAELARRVESDPELARTWQRLRRRWQDLELPDPAPPPPGFAGRVMAEVRAEARAGAGLPLWRAPLRIRALAATALAAGLALGALGARWSDDSAADPAETREALALPTSLADTYWSVLGGEPGDGEIYTDTETAGAAEEGEP